jgi:hypothetical protein
MAGFLVVVVLPSSQRVGFLSVLAVGGYEVTLYVG